MSSNTAQSVLFFLRPQRGNIIRGDSTFYFRSFACKDYTARHVLNTRAQPVYYAHYRRRLGTGLLLLRFFSVSLSGNPIGRYFPLMDFGKFRAMPKPM